ncbi:MAG TPA: BatA domain-containing protein [Candidatus Deferrimicrobium sp.]|nr:BatA domain-containing protein [Candidatus Deferrimicrobium sp.]
MFSFLNSTVLLAAVAALIPLVIHLFSKRRVKIVEFSSLKHLKAMQKRQVRRLKIRQLLLLIIRMLIILTIVMAFARPTTTGGSIGSHASVSAVILFDNSASMNRQVADGNLFDVAARQTQQLLETFGESDEVAFIPLAGADAPGVSTRFASVAEAKERLSRLKPGYLQTDLESGLSAAVALLREASNLNKEIYLIVDRQRQSLPDTALLAPATWPVYILDLPIEGSENCGITGIDFGGQLLVPGHDFDVRATVKNYGSDDRSDIIASLFLDDQRVAQTDANVKAGQEATIRFTSGVARGGFHSGFVELSDDHFLPDNRYYFSFRIPEKFNVLIVDGDGAGRFMALALVPNASVHQYWSVKETSPQDLSRVNPDDYDVIILAGAPRLGASDVNRIRLAVNHGRSLFVTYGATTVKEHFNGEWSQVTGLMLEEPMREEFTRAGYFALEAVDVTHPVFSVFGEQGDPVPELKFYTLPRMRPLGEARTLAGFSGGRPALVLSAYGKGRVLTFAGPLLPSYTDITGHAFFVPFISRIAEYLASDLSSYDVRLFCGQPVTRSLPLKSSFGASLELTGPDSTVYSLPPEEEKGALVLHPRPTDRPGVYRIGYLGREIDRFAINLDPSEGDLSAADVDQFIAALGARQFHLIKGDKNVAAAIAELRFGKELWQVFLWAAVILLAIEMLLARAAPAED